MLIVEKIFDENCAREWRQKFLDVYNGLSPEMMDWAIEGVKFKAEKFLKKGMVTALDGDVVKSDIAILKISSLPFRRMWSLWRILLSMTRTTSPALEGRSSTWLIRHCSRSLIVVAKYS
jgi:hypothetical protein